MSYIDDLKDCIEFTINTQDHALHPLMRYVAVTGIKYGRFNGEQALGYLTLDQLNLIPTKIVKMTWWAVDPMMLTTGYWDTQNNPLITTIPQIRIRVTYLKPTLQDLGYSLDQIKAIVKDAFKSSRTLENPDGDLF